MTRFVLGVVLLASASSVSAQSTDFGIRSVGGQRVTVEVAQHQKVQARQASATVVPLGTEPARQSTNSWAPLSSGGGSINAAARIGAQWGRVTSTLRSVAHNRAVGGVPNSYHLRGRAIDIARRPGVSHGQIAAAFKNAGYRLVESLDEGDHSHFAFNFGGGGWSAPVTTARASAKEEGTRWGVVTVASAILR